MQADLWTFPYNTMAPLRLECVVPGCLMGEESWKTQELEFDQAKQLLDAHVAAVHNTVAAPPTQTHGHGSRGKVDRPNLKSGVDQESW